MADKRITDVDFIDSLNSDESFFINHNSTLKQISKNDILKDTVFDVANGGTGATTPEQARANLGVDAAVIYAPILTGDINQTLADRTVYTCSNVTSLSLTVPQNVCAHLFVDTITEFDIVFSRGVGVTLKAPEGLSLILEADCSYEISVWNGNIAIQKMVVI